jgi:Family of unknown function (DUF6624)
MHDEKNLSAALIIMTQEDMAVRAKLASDGSLFQGYHPEMEEVHRRNAENLRQIVERYGWPTRSKVGDEASKAAFLILQHAIGEPDFQRRGLRWLEEAATAGDIPPLEVAMLEDRIRCFEGMPQRFGTQFDWDADGQMSPHPVENPVGVDERRAAVGLPPLVQAIQEMRQQVAESSEVPPVDWAERKRAEQVWLRKVGWRP